MYIYALEAGFFQVAKNCQVFYQTVGGVFLTFLPKIKDGTSICQTAGDALRRCFCQKTNLFSYPMRSYPSAPLRSHLHVASRRWVIRRRRLLARSCSSTSPASPTWPAEASRPNCCLRVLCLAESHRWVVAAAPPPRPKLLFLLAPAQPRSVGDWRNKPEKPIKPSSSD